jgi:hypothetical protein
MKLLAPEPFKKCSMCGKEWNKRDSFLDDSDVLLNGYQWNRKRVQEGFAPNGLLIFTHMTHRCGTSLAIAASKFKDIRDL